MRRIPRNSDEHLLRSTEELFFSLPCEPTRCRLCGGSFCSERWAGHLDYHRELSDEYRPIRAALERRVMAAGEKLCLELDAKAWRTPTCRQLERHEKFYGQVPAELVAAMGVEAEKAPQLPPRVAKLVRKRQTAAAA